MKLNEYKNYFNNSPIYFTKKTLLREDEIPLNKRKYNKFGKTINEAVDNDDLVPGVPVNKPMKFDQNLLIKMVNYGMIILINYSGDEDSWKGGRERTIYPMVLGKNRNTGNMLLRAWHLEGWSVHKRSYATNEWRLFKTENIKSMVFTGDFFRMAPKNYRMNDRVMTEKTIIAADFNTIRKNQQTLLNSNKIQTEKEEKIGEEENLKVIKIDIRNTDSQVDLGNPWTNEYFNRNKIDDIKLTILKTIFGNNYIAVFGGRGTEGRTVKVYEDTTAKGDYKVIKTIVGREIDKVKNVNSQRLFDLYTFNKIIS